MLAALRKIRFHKVRNLATPATPHGNCPRTVSHSDGWRRCPREKDGPGKHRPASCARMNILSQPQARTADFDRMFPHLRRPCRTGSGAIAVGLNGGAGRGLPCTTASASTVFWYSYRCWRAGRDRAELPADTDLLDSASHLSAAIFRRAQFPRRGAGDEALFSSRNPLG